MPRQVKNIIRVTDIITRETGYWIFIWVTWHDTRWSSKMFFSRVDVPISAICFPSSSETNVWCDTWMFPIVLQCTSEDNCQSLYHEGGWSYLDNCLVTAIIGEWTESPASPTTPLLPPHMSPHSRNSSLFYHWRICQPQSCLHCDY